MHCRFDRLTVTHARRAYVPTHCYCIVAILIVFVVLARLAVHNVSIEDIAPYGNSSLSLTFEIPIMLDVPADLQIHYQFRFRCKYFEEQHWWDHVHLPYPFAHYETNYSTTVVICNNLVQDNFTMFSIEMQFCRVGGLQGEHDDCSRVFMILHAIGTKHQFIYHTLSNCFSLKTSPHVVLEMQLELTEINLK